MARTSSGRSAGEALLDDLCAGGVEVLEDVVVGGAGADMFAQRKREASWDGRRVSDSLGAVDGYEQRLEVAPGVGVVETIASDADPCARVADDRSDWGDIFGVERIDDGVNDRCG